MFVNWFIFLKISNNFNWQYWILTLHKQHIWRNLLYFFVFAYSSLMTNLSRSKHVGRSQVTSLFFIDYGTSCLRCKSYTFACTLFKNYLLLSDVNLVSGDSSHQEEFSFDAVMCFWVLQSRGWKICLFVAIPCFSSSIYEFFLPFLSPVLFYSYVLQILSFWVLSSRRFVSLRRRSEETFYLTLWDGSIRVQDNSEVNLHTISSALKMDACLS
jgi:hypothetical protein